MVVLNLSNGIVEVLFDNDNEIVYYDYDVFVDTFGLEALVGGEGMKYVVA
jgi:hypothetical protein